MTMFIEYYIYNTQNIVTRIRHYYIYDSSNINNDVTYQSRQKIRYLPEVKSKTTCSMLIAEIPAKNKQIFPNKTCKNHNDNCRE